jgi:integrase
MPSAYINRTDRRSSDGRSTVRYRVLYRIGGRGYRLLHGGSFETLREAKARRDWIAGELAAMRIPDLELLERRVDVVLLRDLAGRWRESRIGVSEGTAKTYDVNLGRILDVLGDRDVAAIEPADVAELVARLDADGLARESIRKTLSTLALVFDFGGRKGERNPARDRDSVQLPYEQREELAPPSAEHVEAVWRLLPTRYRLPLLVLDATGMRVGELEALTWGDVDEGNGRWRVTAAASKTRRPRWVQVPELVFRSVLELCPRDDRVAERRVFQGTTSERLRTAIGRACTASGVPAFSPHDLRHRRISLLHAQHVSWARIGELVGQRNLAVTANTYTHVLVDEAELDFARLLESGPGGDAPVIHAAVRTAGKALS